jgi:hypothetical protein
MSTREDIYRLVEQLPEDKFEHAERMLSFIINPPPTSPQLAELRKRGDEYKKRVEERYRETRKPGTISGMGGGGQFGFHPEHGSFGSHSFHYWDDKALVYQTMRHFSGQEVEQMERLSFSEDGKQLRYQQELSSGGHTVRHEETFPFGEVNEDG